LFIFGFIHGEIASNRINPLKSYSGREAVITGKVVGIPQYTDDKDIYIIELMSIKDMVSERSFQVSQTNRALSHNSILAENKESNEYKKCRIRLSVYPRDKAESGQVFKPGDIIRAGGKIREPDGQRNPKGFDYKAYLNRQGISNIMSTGSYDIVLLKEGN